VLNELYVYNIDSPGVTKISDVCEALYPAWSPYDPQANHGYVVFITSYLECLPTGETKHMSYIDVDTGDVGYLPTGIWTAYRTDPEFTPGGEHVIFAEFTLGNSDIHMMDFPSGDNEHSLTDYGSEFNCTMSPDEMMIAYASSREDNTDVYVRYLPGGAETRVTYHVAIDKFPTFSPDGKKIAFVSYRDDGNHAEIYITNLTGDYFFNITDDPYHNDLAPHWSGEIF
jgi:TolB protein